MSTVGVLVAALALLQSGAGARTNVSAFAPIGPKGRFVLPVDLALATDDKTLFVADGLQVVHIRPGSRHFGVVIGLGEVGSWFNGASAAATPVAYPRGLAASPNGKHLLIADTGNDRIVDVNLVKGTVDKVVCGDYRSGPTCDVPESWLAANSSRAVELREPRDVALTSDGRTAFVADSGNNRILRVNLEKGTYEVFAGGLLGWWLSAPSGVALAPDDDWLYVADSGNNRVLRFYTKSQAGEVLIGKGWSRWVLRNPTGLAASRDGRSLYIADTDNNRVVRWSFDGFDVTENPEPFVGNPDGTLGSAIDDCSGTGTLLARPRGLAVSADGRRVYVADTGNQRVVVLERETGPAVVADSFETRLDMSRIGIRDKGCGDPSQEALIPE